MNGRRYGPGPYQFVLLHGGPGAPGSVGTLADELSKDTSVLEPFQAADSVKGQIEELGGFIDKYTRLPVIIAGHSWGAWLAYLFTAKYPEKVQRLILISSGPYEEKYASSVMQTRLSRFTRKERILYDQWMLQWDLLGGRGKKLLLKKLGRLLLKVDGYELVRKKDRTIDYQPDIFEKVWDQARYLRSSGALLKEGKKIKCRVIAIHGDFDPHPWEGVKEPLRKLLSDFEFFLLERCGHEPWLEKRAKGKFYEILREALFN